MAREKRTSTVTTKIFAERLDDLVNEKKGTGKKQKEIAAELGISSGTLSGWCNDVKTPPIDVLPNLAKYFNVSTDYLLGLTEARSTEENIKVACKTTGLSEEAIGMLNVYQNEPNLYHIIDLLNHLILDQNDSNTLSHIASVAIAICTLLDDPFTQTIQGQINLAGLRWTCQNEFTQFIDRYTKI